MTAGFLSGFVAVFYYRWLDSLRFFPATIASLGGGGFVRTATLLPVLAKIGVDVGVYEPCYDTLYITIQALLRAEPRQILRELKAKVLKIWKLAPRYWILADLLNFSLVPLRLRISFPDDFPFAPPLVYCTAPKLASEYVFDGALCMEMCAIPPHADAFETAHRSIGPLT